MAQLLLESGSKADFREPTDELFPRTTLSDEPLRLALKNHHYVSFTPTNNHIQIDVIFTRTHIYATQ